MRTFSRIRRLPPYVFNITNELKMAARPRGDDVIDLSMGNPDGPTPKHIVDKLMEASARPDTHGYSVSKGIPRLRKAICSWYSRRYGVELDADSEAIVTIGSKEGLAHLMLACLERGDTVLVPNPSYPIHIYGAIIAGADIRSVRMTPGVDFFAELERAIRELTPKPKMLVLGFPSNPTAQCVDLAFFERVIAIAKEHDILGMVEKPKAPMYVWAKIPEFYSKLGSIEFTQRLIKDAKIAVAPGIGFGDYGDDQVRIALIENEPRLRQAARGIRDMFRKDGLLRGAA